MVLSPKDTVSLIGLSSLSNPIKESRSLCKVNNGVNPVNENVFVCGSPKCSYDLVG